MRGFVVRRAGARFGRVGVEGHHGVVAVGETPPHHARQNRAHTCTIPPKHVALFETNIPLFWPIIAPRHCPRCLVDPSSHLCRKGHTYRGLLHPRAAHPRCSGGVQPRRDRTCPVCRVRLLNTYLEKRGKQSRHLGKCGGGGTPKQRRRAPSINMMADSLTCSDGIARVHGMANVQAEELVE